MATEYAEVTKEQFHAYDTVRQSGLTNMWAVDYVKQLAMDMTGVELTDEHCFYIMKHFGELIDKHGKAVV